MGRRLRSAAPHLGAYALLVVAGIVAAGQVTLVRVSGGSMVPSLYPGDIVIVARRQAPAPGDIVLMRAGEGLVLHRVTDVAADGSVSTRGDANPIADFSATARSGVRGTVRRVIPLGAALERWRGRGAYATLPARTP